MPTIAKYIDHTLLKPTMGPADCASLCAEAVTGGFKAVCVPPGFVKQAREALAGTDVLVSAVVSFPYGYDAPTVKAAAIWQAVQDGAQELDVVGNYGLVVNGRLEEAALELALVKQAAGDTPVKLIIETSELDDDQIVAFCELCAEAGIDCVKTSTGTTKQGANPRVVSLMNETLRGRAWIKAAGGIRSLSDARALIEAGAERLGTSRGSQLIDEEGPVDFDYDSLVAHAKARVATNDESAAEAEQTGAEEGVAEAVQAGLEEETY